MVVWLHVCVGVRVWVYGGLFVCVWVYGCMGGSCHTSRAGMACMCGCMGVWVYGCMGVWVGWPLGGAGWVYGGLRARLADLRA